MKSMVHKILAISLAVWLIPAAAMAAMMYNTGGYAPNTRSPVVGGWVLKILRWDHRVVGDRVLVTNQEIRPFGDVELSGGRWFAGGTYIVRSVGPYYRPPPPYTVAAQCPPNTAKISVGSGYLADNGVWYNALFYMGEWGHNYWAYPHDTVVCVNTDTGSGQYGAQ